MPVSKREQEPYVLVQFQELFPIHPSATVTAKLLRNIPIAVLFEADVVAPKSIGTAMACNMGAPLWKALSPETVRKLALENYERSFDDGRRELRLAVEHQNLGAQALQ